MSTRATLIAALCAVALSATTLTGCATTSDHKVKSAKLAHRRRGGSLPKNYSLFTASTVNYHLLRKGQKNRGSPALDTY